MKALNAKELLLLRHAQAAFTHPVYDDFDRPLDPEGFSSLGKLLSALQDDVITPEIVLCSPARRARETLDVVRPFLPESSLVFFEEALYLANLQRMLECLETLPFETQRAMVIGHNPGLDQLIRWLLRDVQGAENLGTFPMAGLAHVTIHAPSWALNDASRGELVRWVMPPAESPSQHFSPDPHTGGRSFAR